MTAGKTSISVVIPVFNGSAYILEAVKSVWAQKYNPLEIIVVDDGSTDRTASIIREFTPACRYIFQENQGPQVARNTGIRAADGDVIGFLDADDLWPANKLELQLSLLAEETGVEMVLGNTQYFREHHQTADKAAWTEYVEPYFIIQIGCALFRRAVFDKVGLFDPTLKYGEDFDFLLRTREQKIPTRFVDNTTILYRRHPGNMTQEEGHQSLSFLSLVKRSLDRRREMGIDQLDLSPWTER